MKRRHFIKAIGLASTAVVFAKDLFARETRVTHPFRHAHDPHILGVPLCRSTDPNLVMTEINGGVIDCPECIRISRSPPYRGRLPSPTVFKVTGLIDRIGFESRPYSVTANDDGYLLLPELLCPEMRRHIATFYDRNWFDADDFEQKSNFDRYALYASMPGFEQTGPWYLIRTISRREARRARYTIAAPINYNTSDLVPQLCPRESESFSFQLPPSDEGQTGWRIYGGDFSGVGQHHRPASILVDIPESARL